MTLIDRRYSVAEGTAVKAPCRAATTANITLSGEQTIDGIACVQDDRVLVQHQTDGTTNGIYTCSTGNWTRTRDFDGAYDIVKGTRIFVTSGTIGGGAEFVVTTADPIIIGTTSIAFTSIIATANASAAAAAASATAASGSQTAAASSATTAGTSATAAAASATAAAASVTSIPMLIPNYISGLVFSTAGSSGTMSIAAGAANDSTNTALMKLTALSKTTSAWAVGSGNGGIDTGAIANSTTYHFYLIERTDTGVTDVIFSLSATVPAFPTNYTLARYINSWRTDSSAHWESVTQVGDQFIRAASAVDVNNIASTASRVSTPLSVPTGVVVTAMFRGSVNFSGTGTISTRFTSLLENDVVTTAANSDLTQSVSGASSTSGSFARITDTSAQIGVRSAATGGTVSVNTYGWINTRGK